MSADELDKVRRQADPTCPVCFYKVRDAWEINFGPGIEGDTEIQCGSCETIYECARTVDVYYTSSIITSKGKGAP